VTLRLEAGLPWLALMVAFSPVLADLARDLIDYPEGRFTLIAPVLLWLAWRRAPATAGAARRGGAIAIAVGVALQLVGIFVDAWSIARFGLPVAACGLARWLGRPNVAVAALAFFAIPLPDTIVLMPSPALETGLARFTEAALRGIGVPVVSEGFSLFAGTARIELRPVECGVSLAFTLAALGWYAAAAAGEGVAAASRRAALFALFVIPIQPLVTFVSGILLGAGLRDAGQLWLSHGGWLLASLAGLAWIHRRSVAR
jgi:hypothetical protein